MKSLEIRYFSATGNTKRAVDLVVETCSAAGIATTAASIESLVGGPVAGDGEEALLVAFPILAFSAPGRVRNYLASLPPGGGRETHILAVCGSMFVGESFVDGWPGRGIEHAESQLRRKGYDVVSSGFLSYPENWTQMADPPAGEDAQKLRDIGDVAARRFAKGLAEASSALYRCGPGGALASGVAAFLFNTAGRRFLGKIYVADAACDACGYCARICPVGAIRMTEREPVWNASCDACNRCINACPRRAIQVSVAKAALHLGASVALVVACFPLTRAILGAFGLAHLGAVEVIAALALATALTPPLLLALFGPVDALIRLASRLPPVRRFFAWSLTRRFGRYLAPGFSPKGH